MSFSMSEAIELLRTAITPNEKEECKTYLRKYLATLHNKKENVRIV